MSTEVDLSESLSLLHWVGTSPWRWYNYWGKVKSEAVGLWAAAMSDLTQGIGGTYSARRPSANLEVLFEVFGQEVGEERN